MVKLSEEVMQSLISNWLKDNDYDVRFEVKISNNFIDIIALRQKEITSIEVKEDFYRFKDGINQCFKYSKFSHRVFLAFPESHLADLKNKYNIRDFPFGFIVVDEKGNVKIIKESKQFKPQKETINFVNKRFKISMKEIKEPIKLKTNFFNTPEIRRIIKKTSIECLWIYLLTLLFNGPRHAYGFQKEIKEKFNFSTGIITVYKVLYFLERGGFVKKVNIKHKSGGPKRKYYKITKKGIKLLGEGRDIIEEITHKLLWEF